MNVTGSNIVADRRIFAWPLQALARQLADRFGRLHVVTHPLMSATGATGAMCLVEGGALIVLDPTATATTWSHELAHLAHLDRDPLNFASSIERREYVARSLEGPLLDHECTSIDELWGLWTALTGENL